MLVETTNTYTWISPIIIWLVSTYFNYVATCGICHNTEEVRDRSKTYHAVANIVLS